MGGGFNDIWAKNIIEFMAEVKRQFGNSNLKVDYTTLHKATESSAKSWDKSGNMMCW
jgi:threonyl-tRNA synthetase